MTAPRAPSPHRGRGPDAQTPENAPVIIIHSPAHAVAALTAAAEARRPVILASAADAGTYAGPGWFREVIAAAQEAVPTARFSALLDCGADAGAAMAAIRAGIAAVVFTGRADVAARLADIARQSGARLVTQRPAAVLDLRAAFFADEESLRRRCADALASPPAFC